MTETGVDRWRRDGDDGSPRAFARRDEAAGLRRSRARILLAAEADRRALERALHDGLQQQLVALAVGIGQVRRVVEEDPSAAKATLDDLGTLAREAIDEAARLAQWIHPSRPQDPRSLPGALRAVAGRLGITVTIDVSTVVEHPPETFVALYWCCAEALALAPAGTEASVTVRDRDGGLGFEVVVADAYSEGRSERLRDRVEALGGWLRVDGTAAASRIAGLVPSP